MSGIKKFLKNIFSNPKGNTAKSIKNTEDKFEEHNPIPPKKSNNKKNELPFNHSILSIEESRSVRALAHKSVKLNIILGLTVALLVLYSGVVTWYAVHPQKEYFATDRGRIIPLTPLNRPHKTVQQVIQFSRDALLDSFSLDFVNYRKKLEDSRKYYTEAGFSNFLNALQSSSILNLVKEKRMNIFVTVGTGVLTKRVILNGVYQWEVQVPLTLKPVGQTTEIAQQTLLVTLRINRTSVLDTNEGIAINQLITRISR